MKLGKYEVEPDESFGTWVAAILVLAVLAFGLIGYGQAKSVDYPLSPSGWQEVQLRRAYNEELTRLSGYADQLDALLAQRPDAVEAQITAQRLGPALQTGSDLLKPQRDALGQALDTVVGWSMGQVSQEDAAAAVQRARDLIDAGRPDGQTQQQ